MSRIEEGRYTLEGIHKWASQLTMFYSPIYVLVTFLHVSINFPECVIFCNKNRLKITVVVNLNCPLLKISNRLKTDTTERLFTSA